MKTKIILVLILTVILSGCLQPPNEPVETKESGGESEAIQTMDVTESQESSNEEEGTSLSNDEPISETEKEICEDAVSKINAIGEFDFTAEETIIIDKVIRYYTCFMMCDESGELIPDLVQYRTGKSFYEIKVPKDVVKLALQQLFIPPIDDTSSVFEDPADSNYYILDAKARGHVFSRCLSYERNNGIIEVECEGGWIDPEPPEGDGYNVTSRYVLGLKITDDKYAYAYCNIIE